MRRDIPADANDPPDAPEDAAVFMHDLSHGAWHLFTQHVAQEAASVSGSSFQTVHRGDSTREVRHLLFHPPPTSAELVYVCTPLSVCVWGGGWEGGIDAGRVPLLLMQLPRCSFAFFEYNLKR
jgi:hypothetical protein